MSQRFTDAELAAEFWFASGEFNAGTEGYRVEWFGGETRFTRNDELRAQAQVETLKRFATLPHAQDEPGAYVFQCKNCPASWETDDEQRLKIFARNHQYLSHDYWKENQ